MRGVILAAGFGTRLWPLTEERTKPAIPFLNRPLIAYSVEYLAGHGIKDIIINLHHQPESVRSALGDGSSFGVSITYSYEEEILGTSGALDRVRGLLIEDDFVVVNGKIVTTIDLTAAVRGHRQAGAIATLVLLPNKARERFTVVETDARSGRINRFDGFPEPTESQANAAPGGGGAAAPLMFTGIQVLSPRIFDYIPRNRFSHTTVDVYPRAIEAGEAVMGHLGKGDWYELSTPRRYLEASLALVRQTGQKLVSGPGLTIEDGALVEDSVLWDGVTVEKRARVRQSVLADKVRIPAGLSVEGSVVVRRDRVRELERGEIIGDNVVVPL